MQIVSKTRFNMVLGRPDMRTRWIAGTAPYKSGRCRNKSRSNNHTQTIMDVRYLPQVIHGRKSISISCNKIEQWVHLRCAGIHLAHYTDTWTCHLHKTYSLTTHTDITLPFQTLVKAPTPLPTYTTNTTATQTQTHVQQYHRIGKTQTQSSYPLLYGAESNTYTFF